MGLSIRWTPIGAGRWASSRGDRVELVGGRFVLLRGARGIGSFATLVDAAIFAERAR